MAKVFVSLSFLLAIVVIGISALKLPQIDKLALIASGLGKNSLESQNVDVIAISTDQFKEILKQYPNATLLKPNPTGSIDGFDDWTFSYSLGRRIPGDELVGRAYDNLDWGYSGTLSNMVGYPSGGGESDTLSYISILVTLNSPWCRVFIFRGGVDYRFASIRILVEQTTFVRSTVEFYGY